jgi:hypothetical protein
MFLVLTHRISSHYALYTTSSCLPFFLHCSKIRSGGSCCFICCRSSKKLGHAGFSKLLFPCVPSCGDNTFLHRRVDKRSSEGSVRERDRETERVGESHTQRDRICESGLCRTSEGILIFTLLEFCDLKQVCLKDPFAFLSHQTNHVGYSSFSSVLSGTPKLL